MTSVLSPRPTMASKLKAAPDALRLLQNLGVVVILVLVTVVVSLIEPKFLSRDNLDNILVNASILAVAGFGMTLVVALRGIDLSVGSVQALTASVVATLLATHSLVIAVAAALAVGLVAGCANGLIVAKFAVPAFVATLGTMSIVRGIALLYTNGESRLIKNSTFGELNTGEVLGVPMPFVLALLVLAVMWTMLNHHPFGRHVAATGGNEAAARAAGLNTSRITVAVFAIAGLVAGLSGVMVAAQLQNADPSLGTGFELNVIAITVLGGTSLAGGAGNLPGTLVAAVLVSTINSSLNILGVAAFYQYLAVGLLLVVALALEALRRRLLQTANRETGGQ